MRLLLPLLLLSLATAAQTRTTTVPATELKLLAVHASGSERFGERDIVIASGLKPGERFSEQALALAVDRLTSSGAFSQVEYRYVPLGSGVEVRFKVADSPEWFPVTFENFVWFSDDEIVARLRQKVPFFAGEVSGTGQMADRINAVLQQMLRDRGLPGQVEHLGNAKPSGPIERLVYSVEGVRIRVGAVKFPGASAAMLPELQKATEFFRTEEYRRSSAAITARHDVLAKYREQGYLAAEMAEPAATVIETKAEETRVEVSFPVLEGPQYRWRAARWTGVQSLSLAQVEKTVGLTAGLMADGRKLESGVDRLRKLYGSRGFVRAAVKSSTTLHEDGTASCDVAVTEGPAFRMGAFHILGVEPKGAEALRKHWKLNSGQPFSTDYLNEYFREVGTRYNLQPFTIEMKQAVNEQAQTVDVTLVFKARPQQ